MDYTVYTCLEAIEAAFFSVLRQAEIQCATMPDLDHWQEYEAVMEHRLRLFEICVALHEVRAFLLQCRHKELIDVNYAPASAPA